MRGEVPPDQARTKLGDVPVSGGGPVKIMGRDETRVYSVVADYYVYSANDWAVRRYGPFRSKGAATRKLNEILAEDNPRLGQARIDVSEYVWERSK
jgi:hypothetical protein